MTMWIILVLTGLVLMLGRSMRVEAVCSANGSSMMQAQAIEQGAIQYVLAHLDGYSVPPTEDDMPCEAMPVGRGGFWIIRPDISDDVNSIPQGVAYGVVDEGSKLSLNGITPPATSPVSATVANRISAEMLKSLFTNLSGGASAASSIADQLADCVTDWRTAGGGPRPSGAKNEYYLLLSNPYKCKEAPLETIDELFLVKGFTKEIIYGQDINRNGMLDQGEENTGDLQPTIVTSGNVDRGIYPLVTAYSIGQAWPQAANSPKVKGLLNISTAPREVLNALKVLGLDDNDITALVNKRSEAGADLSTATWVAEAFGNDLAKIGPISPFITTKSYRYSADIVSVSGDGRAFRRCRVIVDTQQSPPRVIFRQDLTHLGWPLDSGIISRLRSGQAFEDATGVNTLEETPQ